MTDASKSISSPLDLPPNTGGKISTFHVVIICLSLMLTLGAWQFSKSQIQTRVELRYAAERDRTIGLIKDRMLKYEDALWAGVAALESHGGDISLEDWKAFANALSIEEKYPGINGIGVIHYLSEQALPNYMTTHLAERPDFRIYPEHTQNWRMPITYIEPVDINAAAVGLDMAHEENRRTAALASRDTGTAQITGAISLVQDANSTPGFLFFAPLYRGGPPDSADAREELFLGTVYAPFVVHKLMEGLLNKSSRDVRFSITDNDVLIYDEHKESDPLYDPSPLFSETVTLALYGRQWTLDVRTNLQFRAENTYAQSTFILCAGLMIEGLIIALILLMARANKRAVTYANAVTHKLKEKSQALLDTNRKLSLKNEEIEQFAYIASHDLRTPIRGICGLTEMIEEDLEDYFASDAANPDVQESLQQIQQRVERMNRLTLGIMEFSKHATFDEDVTHLVLADVVASLTLDLGLEDGQIELTGDVASVQCDAFNLRRVIENLVGNAIKYHDGHASPKVRITATALGDRVHLSVQDNGPGIDPQFHERIFDVFQTLRSGTAKESTGIGLAIVKKAVEANNGAIKINSAVGQGATFTFDWPLHAPCAARQTQEAA